MAIIRGPLANIAQLPSTVGSIYSNPSSTKTFIKGITLFNTNTTTETVKLYLVPDNTGAVDTATDAHQFTEILLVPKESFLFEFPGDGAVFGDLNDTLQGVTTTASKVNFYLHGVIEQ